MKHIKKYLYGLYLALCNKPVVAIREMIVTRPFTKEQLKRLFAPADYHDGMTLEQVAFDAGQVRVINYLHNLPERGLTW